MAKPKENTKDIAILYDASDSEAWVSYIKGCFNECPKKLNIDTIDLVSNFDTFGELSKQYTLLLLVISDKMVKTLQDNVALLSSLLDTHRAITVLKLYIDNINYEDEIVQYYNSAKDWKCFSIGNDDGVEQVQEAISHIIDVVQECKAKSKPAVRHPRQSYIQLVCPDSVRQGGELVTMVLKRPVDEGQLVQVKIGTDDTAKLIDTERLNQFCFCFKAPASKAGRTSMYLYIDGRKKCRHPLRYSSMTRFAYTYPEFLCQLIGLNHDDNAGLDKELTNIFKNSAPQDATLEKLLTPKIMEASSTVASSNTDDVGELPTLLHFACKYSLNDLATCIIDSPGAFKAIHMDNNRGLKPIHLAEESNNEELKNYIEDFMLLHDYVTEAEDLYEKMSKGKVGYIDMGHKRDTVEEAYVRGHAVGLRESDYEITSGSKGLVQEVLPEEDIAPEVPARPPRPERRPSQPQITPDIGPKPRAPIPPRNDPTPPRNDPIPPVNDDWATSGCIPDNDQFFSGKRQSMVSYAVSSASDELVQYVEAYKKGEFGLDDIERLYQAWHDRNRNNKSLSFSERQKQIDEFKKVHTTKLPKKKMSILPWKKKSERPKINIEHNVEPNNYESWTIMRGEKTEIRSRSDSCVSNISNISSSSCSSRDSGLEPVAETDSEDDVPGYGHNRVLRAAPPVPRRSKAIDSPDASSNRKSWGDEYLLNTKKKAKARLPTPPSQKKLYGCSNSNTLRPPPRPPRS